MKKHRELQLYENYFSHFLSKWLAWIIQTHLNLTKSMSTVFSYWGGSSAVCQLSTFTEQGGKDKCSRLIERQEECDTAWPAALCLCMLLSVIYVFHNNCWVSLLIYKYFTDVRRNEIQSNWRIKQKVINKGE